ncbi:MAG: DUF1080 domain-containing protein [Bryobacteraceae bacterium]|jgi:hypothetical protein
MSRLLTPGAMICFLAAAARLWGADNQLTTQEKADGWILLFDGHSFAGWEDPARKSPTGDSFTIADGCLRATPHPRIDEDLFTERTWGDFEFDFDWKISPAGNSGVKYRIQDRIFLLSELKPRFEDLANDSALHRRADRPARGQEYVVGFEYQITDNAANPDAVRNGPLHRTAALYDISAPLKDATRPVGEFNRSRLIVKGKHVEHWLNGEKVVDAGLDAPEVAAAMAKRWGAGTPIYKLLVGQPRQQCRISLQNHNDEAWFKNLKIRELN